MIARGCWGQKQIRVDIVGPPLKTVASLITEMAEDVALLYHPTTRSTPKPKIFFCVVLAT